MDIFSLGLEKVVVTTMGSLIDQFVILLRYQVARERIYVLIICIIPLQWWCCEILWFVGFLYIDFPLKEVSWKAWMIRNWSYSDNSSCVIIFISIPESWNV